MRKAMRRLGIGMAVAALAAWTGCGGGDGPGGTDGDARDGEVVKADAADAEASPDEVRPDVPEETGPGDALPDGDAPGEAGDVQPDAPPCDAAAAIATGRDWLEKGESAFARNAFDDAVAACPDDAQARLGAALSEMLLGSELFVSALTVATGNGTGPQLAYPVSPDGDGDGSRNDQLAAKLHVIFMALRQHYVKGLEHLEAIGDREVDFAVGSVPVYLGIQPRMALQGRFDAGDVLLMRAVGSLMVGLLDTLAGQDFRTDILSMAAKVRSGIDGSIDFPWISRLAAFLLEQDPRFLAAHPDDGALLFEEARQRLSDVGPLLAAALPRMRQYGSGEDQVSFVEDIGVDTVLNVRSRVTFDDDGVAQQEPWYLVLGEGTMEAFRQASESIRTPGARVTLHGAVLPVLATVLNGFVRVGVLEVLGVSLPGGLDLSVLEVDDLTALLKGLLPNVMAFDWGEFYRPATGPVGLRAWLPAITTDRPMMQNELVAEWECPEDTAADGYPTGSLRLLCAKDATLADGPHFEGTGYATEADGIDSTFPVLGFADPSLHGLAYVDLAGTDGNPDASAYQPASGTTLNAALARMLAGVLSLVGN